MVVIEVGTSIGIVIRPVSIDRFSKYPVFLAFENHGHCGKSSCVEVDAGYHTGRAYNCPNKVAANVIVMVLGHVAVHVLHGWHIVRKRTININIESLRQTGRVAASP